MPMFPVTLPLEVFWFRRGNVLERLVKEERGKGRLRRRGKFIDGFCGVWCQDIA